MENVLSLLRYALWVYFFFFALSTIFLLIKNPSHYQYSIYIWKKFTPKIFFEQLAVLVVVITVMILLWKIPIFRIGWTTIFFDRPTNLIAMPLVESVQSDSIYPLFLAIFFIFILILEMPFMIKAEEKRFRKGYNNWSKIYRQSIIFGLAHCLVGVPLAAGIALSFGGFFFAYKYKTAYDKFSKNVENNLAQEKALEVSTIYHTMNNTIVMSITLFLISLLVLLRILTMAFS